MEIINSLRSCEEIEEAASAPAPTQYTGKHVLPFFLTTAALGALAACSPVSPTPAGASATPYEAIATLQPSKALFETNYPFAQSIPRVETDIPTYNGEHIKFILLEPFYSTMQLNNEGIVTWANTIKTLVESDEPIFEPFAHAGQEIHFNPVLDQAYQFSQVFFLPINVATIVDPANPQGTGNVRSRTISTPEGELTTFIVPDYTNPISSSNGILFVEMCQQEVVLLSADGTVDLLTQELFCNALGVAANAASTGIPYAAYRERSQF